MIGHFLKLVWNRRRSNVLIMIELLISFVGLSVIITTGFATLNFMNQPLGFDYEDLWTVDLVPQLDYYMQDVTEEERGATWAQIHELELLFQTMPEIVAATPFTTNVPYRFSNSGYPNFINGGRVFVHHTRVKPEAMDVLRFELVAGRWLEPGDEALDWNPTVLSRNYAEALFGTQDPIGQTFRVIDSEGNPEKGVAPFRVVGVIESWRKNGELNSAPATQFSTMKYDVGSYPPANYVLRVAEGAPAAFEEELTRGIQQVMPRWRVSIAPMEKDRERMIRENTVPLMIGGGVAVFLLIMVGLGLIGVTWQNVTRRTEELGLRRALGSTARGIRGLVLGELLALTSVAVAVGGLLYVQVPLLDVVPEAKLGVYVGSFVTACLVIYIVVTLCGLYPSWLATRIQPAEALQYE
jgi:putative ABC transport system permease protein